jgi:hypothetical protein
MPEFVLNEVQKLRSLGQHLYRVKAGKQQLIQQRHTPSSSTSFLILRARVLTAQPVEHTDSGWSVICHRSA